MNETTFDDGISYLPSIHRSLPCSPDAEQAILCCAMIAPQEVRDEIMERVRREHFHTPAHGTVWGVLVDMDFARTPIDIITLTQSLVDRGILDEVGGPGFITHVFTFTPTSSNWTYYAEVMREKFILRSIITIGTNASSAAYDRQEDVGQALEEFEKEVLSIRESSSHEEAEEPIRESVMQAMEGLERIIERKGRISGISTGLPDLDQMIDGMHPAEMLVLAGRPSSGKTSIAMNIAEHVALDLNLPVAVFSLEMSKQQVLQRAICSRARVSTKKIRDGFLADSDHQRITGAASQFAHAPLYINDKRGLNMHYIGAVCRRLKRKNGLSLIVIDYLQLLKGVKKYKGDNRQAEVAEISGGIKDLAKELDLPILVLAQLSRDPDKRTGSNRGRPRLSDLRESGAIEQDADVVGLVFREEMYAENEEEKQEALGKATLIIAKQRCGPIGDIPLTFIREFTRFEPRAYTPDETQQTFA